MVYALIVAGGKGTRFTSHTLKQYLPLAGVPIVSRTLRVFDDCEVIDRLVVVVPQPDIAFVREEILGPAALRKDIRIIAGGRRRQDSVFNGLAAIDTDESLVVIHDAVRPLVSRESITACVNTALHHGACIVALPVWDTLKRTTVSGIIETTLPRERVWLAQTPQAFRTRLIRLAHECARREAFFGTDDASLVERMGMTVHICRGSRRNIKITTAEDLSLAEALLNIPETEARSRC
jgi:2-C-methyl-D-erythritol 4-phosphate cytidylyltransferase